MRKIVVAGAAALGFLAVAMTVMGHPASFNQAGAEGSGADVRMTRHSLFALTDVDNSRRPLLVAADGGDDSRSSSQA